MTEASRYDHIVINRDIDRALAEVQRLAGLAAGIPPGMHSGEEVPRT